MSNSSLLFEQIHALASTSSLRLVDALRGRKRSGGENSHLSEKRVWRLLDSSAKKALLYLQLVPAYPEFFPPLVIRLLEAGEASGTLAVACAQLCRILSILCLSGSKRYVFCALAALYHLGLVFLFWNCSHIFHYVPS